MRFYKDQHSFYCGIDLHASVKVRDAYSFLLLRSVPGIGMIIAMTILYEAHDMSRFPRRQEFLSYSRLVK